MPIRNRFAELHDEITAWRRDFHTHPEILYDLPRTSGKVAERLKEFGCDEVVTGMGQTGVVGIIKGKMDTSGRTIGLRADMDALPMPEETGLPYASQNAGAMHACGHDGHTSMLLGAAKYLAETRNFDGTIALIFQPAEEGGAGAKAMLDDGLLDRWDIDEFYGMHNWPGLDAGKFAIRSGPFFAATDLIAIEVEGKGGHAAKPDEVIDTTVVAAQIVIALQTIASRNIHPVDPVVVSITSFETSSNAFNVIPQFVQMKGTVRTMSKKGRDLAEERLTAIAENTAKAFGATARVTYDRNYPVMVNSEAETEFAAEAARRVSGQCDAETQTMGGEDFAFFLEERPGAYIFVGNGDTAKVHNTTYDFNDEAIPAGCSWWVEIAESRLPISN